MISTDEKLLSRDLSADPGQVTQEWLMVCNQAKVFVTQIVLTFKLYRSELNYLTLIQSESQVSTSLR